MDWVLTIWLSVMSLVDIVKKSIPVILLTPGVMLVIYTVIQRVGKGNTEYLYLMGALLPGAFFLLLAWMTGKVGAGDGWVLMIMGIVKGGNSCLMICFYGLLCAAVCSVTLLALRRLQPKSEIPFLPFLLMGWIVVVIRGNVI